MRFDLWGTPEEAKPLNDGIKKLLKDVLGVSADDVNTVDPAAIRLTPSALGADHLEALAAIVGAGNVSTDDAQRMPRSRGKSMPDLLGWRQYDVIDAPDAVVAPTDDAQVLAILEYCSANRIAVVPFGGGTSVVGGVSPVRGGFDAVISLDLIHFDALEDLDEISGEATLGAGLTGPRAEALLGALGWQLGHFPQSFPYASIGGYAATRSSGQDSAGYGRFDEMIRGLTVVTPTGIVEVGRAPSSAAGPDLREVFIGSEGVFGIITRVRLRIHRKPAVTRHEAFSFPDFATGAAAVRAVEQQGTGPTVIRLSDEAETGVNLATTDKIGGEQITSGCLCITMFEGTEEHTASRLEETRAVLLAHGGTSLGAGPAEAWEAGRYGAPVLRDALLDNGALCETLETATDWSNVERLKNAVTVALQEALAESGTMALVLCHISHVYATGTSLYFTVVAGQRGDDPVGQWMRAKRAACEAIMANDGTVSHHHAVGTDHRDYMVEEIGEIGVRVLRAIKNEIDPVGILNPGKLIP